MYTGLTVLGGWMGLVFLRAQPKGRLELSMKAVPHGYGLALVALPLAALGGPGDFAWHAAYGFENQVDAPFSPTHQMLFLSGALLGAIPLAAMWARVGRKPRLKRLWPAVLSMTAVVAMVNFTFMNLLPFFWRWSRRRPSRTTCCATRMPTRRAQGSYTPRAWPNRPRTTATRPGRTTCSRTCR